jgi:hypothetical protein
MSLLENYLTEINLILEVIGKFHRLAEITPEFQEGEKQQTIRDFRITAINLALAKLKSINREYERYKDR